LKTPSKDTHEVRTWKDKTFTGPFKQLIIDLYKASGIKVDTPISEDHYAVIGGVLERDYSKWL